ncbi:hypothetical protein SBA7_510008 [Candidatus Sulfotelmatobacter sp. SbA7]|nr:hypothetical protein SBA7_510008 [Candidatus Sulfotelmatobacter sp. SbA7]
MLSKLLQEFEIFRRYDCRDGLASSTHNNPLAALDSVEYRAEITTYVCGRKLGPHEAGTVMMILRLRRK